MRILLVAALLSVLVASTGCQAPTTVSTTQPSLTPQQIAQSVVTGAQYTLYGAELGLTLDEAFGGIKQSPTYAKLVADEKAIQGLINVAQQQVLAGTFDASTFTDGVNAVMATYAADIAAAKASVVHKPTTKAVSDEILTGIQHFTRL